MASDPDAELQAAMAASLADSSTFMPVQFASAGGGGAAYLRDDESALSAAIAASLDGHEVKSGGKGGSGADLSAPPAAPGSNASQDLAFLTDAPLLPPAAADVASRRGGGVAGGGGKDQAAERGGSRSGGGGSRKLVGWSGGAMFGGPTSIVPAAARPGRGRTAVTGGAAHPRTRADEDEALARRLQAQWISEDSAGGSGVGGNGDGDLQWPRGAGADAPINPFLHGVRHCSSCGMAITDATFRQTAAGSFHMGCPPTKQRSLPPCVVCHERLPSENGRIHFYRHNFFKEVYCPWHHDNSARCCSCMRLEPTAKPGGGGEGSFAELQDGRMLCMPCAQTAVVDSAEGAPAYQDVCRFFEQELHLSVPREMREVPVLLVDSPTLNEQTHRDPSHGGGAEQGMPTTRGLTLSEVATVMHMASGAMHFNASMGRFEVGPPSRVNLGERRAVTAILVLCALPYASFSSILAHEAMHAWMKLDPSFPSRLPSQVEEGVCQLTALLWLEHLGGGAIGDDEGRSEIRSGCPPSDRELRGFFAHQIKTDVSEVYGEGFRKAKAAYDAVGLEALLGHIKRYKAFPAV